MTLTPFGHGLGVKAFGPRTGGVGSGGGGTRSTLPVNTVAPAVTGTATKGQILTTTDGTWTGTPVPTLTYQWRRAAVDIAGETNSTYTLAVADRGAAIDCVVTATNAAGAVTADSNDILCSTGLDFSIASVCCDLDATIAASYTSGQTWANLIAAPADGAAQTDYDFWLGAGSGASTDDPTFTGTAGAPAAYFLHDGGDFFTIKNVANPVTIYNMHKKTGGTNSWWVAFAVYRPTAANTFWGRGWTGATHGMYLYNAGNALYQDHTGGITLLSGSGTTANANNLHIVSVDMEGTTNNVRHWSNSTTKTSWSKTWTSDSVNTTKAFIIGGTVTSADVIQDKVANTTRYYHFSAGNAFIDDAQAADIFAHLEARHSRDYTP